MGLVKGSSDVKNTKYAKKETNIPNEEQNEKMPEIIHAHPPSRAKYKIN